MAERSSDEMVFSVFRDLRTYNAVLSCYSIWTRRLFLRPGQSAPQAPLGGGKRDEEGLVLGLWWFRL